MGRFNGVIGASGSGAKSSRDGGSGGIIRKFVKENPDFMKLSGSQRSRMLMEVMQHAKEEELMMKKGGGFRLPGTAASDQEVSESVKHTMEQMMKKKLEKRKMSVLEVKPVWFHGGKIDKNGIIYDEKGYKVGEIDRTNSEIKINGGRLEMKYDKKGPSVGMIKRKVREYNQNTYHKAQSTGTIWGSGSSTTPVDNGAWFFGNNNSNNNGGGFWG